MVPKFEASRLASTLEELELRGIIEGEVSNNIYRIYRRMSDESYRQTKDADIYYYYALRHMNEDEVRQAIREVVGS